MVEQIMIDNSHHDNTKTNGEVEQHEDKRAGVNGDDLAENLNKMKVSENAENGAGQQNDNSQDVICETFEDMDLAEPILKAIYGLGFSGPSPVQSRAVYPHKSGRDVIVQSQSGTGKTLAFALGAICSVDEKNGQPQIIVLCHTRELCAQTAQVFNDLLKFSPINHHVLTGGGPPPIVDSQELSHGKQIIVGTTGKIKNMIERNRFNTAHVKQIICDEADKMIQDVDFIQDISEICNNLPLKSTLQICLYSATIGLKVLEQVKELMRENHYSLLVPTEEVALKGIKQFYHICDTSQYKTQVLLSLTQDLPMETMICFCNTRDEVDEVSRIYSAHNFPYASIHGGMEQPDRESIMAKFRSGQIRYLIATDLLNRGIDVQQISMVINFSLPLQREEYIHRVGRSGRYGRKGIAINLINEDEHRRLNSFEEHYCFKNDVLPADPSSIIED
jgi:superfamily II DNA/RNA helicase